MPAVRGNEDTADKRMLMGGFKERLSLPSVSTNGQTLCERVRDGKRFSLASHNSETRE